MRYDESITWAYFVGRPWSTIVTSYPFPNNHVFHSLLAKIATSAAPWSPWALRLPAFLAGVAIVPLTWAVGRRFADRDTALLGAGLAVGSTPLVLYSANARGYTLVVACFLAMLVIADRIRRGTDQHGWLSLALLGAAGLYTIPVMLYPLGVVALWLALDAARRSPAERRQHLVRIAASSTAAVALAALLYLPISRSAGIGALAGNRFVSPSSWPTFALDLPRFVTELFGVWSSPLPWWCAPLLLLLALAGVRRPARPSGASLTLATMLWCVALLVATHRVPFIRVWLFALPLFLLAVARGMLRLWRTAVAPSVPALRMDAGRAAMLLAAAAGAGAVWTRSAERSDDTGAFPAARAVTTLLAPRLRAGDRVLAPIPTNGPLLYYFAASGLDTASLTVPIDRSSRAFLVLDPSRGQSVDWAVGVGMIDPGAFVEPTLVGRPDGAEVWETERR